MGPALILLADTTSDAASGGGSLVGTLLPLVAFGAIAYFLLIRPQRKRQAQQQQLLDSLAVGHDVVTIGGIHGTVEQLGEDWVDLAVDADGTVLRFARQSIARAVGGDAADEDA